LLNRHVEPRQLSLWCLHHQLELGGLSDEFIGLAKLNGGGWLAPRPQPRHAADDDYEKDEEDEELEEAAHLIIMTSGGGPYKVRPAGVITFLGSACWYHLGVGTRGLSQATGA
jgi:hypothetical protein